MTGRILAIGFGLIVLLGGTYAWWTLRNDRVMRDERVDMLRTDLTQIRKSIAKFKEDNGRYPHSLEELVPKYMRRIPADPVTRRPNWKLDTEETVVPTNDFGATTTAKSETYVIDVHSAAGPPYSTY
ncbi:MAG TPA: hypothetical protein VF787_16595 [Thermoanaerobaculia bacterium]